MKRKLSLNQDQNTYGKRTSKCYNFCNKKEVLYQYLRCKFMSVNNFKSMLINSSNLTDEIQLNHLKEAFSVISFKENARSRNKLQAIIAGSYPTFLGTRLIMIGTM